MDNDSHDDLLAEAFTRFRTEVRQESRPPGTPAVRHTVRRRRGVRVAAATVAVVLIGAVVGIVTTAHRPDPHPRLSAAQLKDLGFQAFRALENEPGFAPGFTAPITGGTRNTAYSIDHMGSSPMSFARGDNYDLMALCVGRGTVIVAWQAAGGVTGRTTAVCGRAAFRIHFIPQTDVAVIRFSLTPDADAIDRAAIAVGYIEYG